MFARKVPAGLDKHIMRVKSDRTVRFWRYKNQHLVGKTYGCLAGGGRGRIAKADINKTGFHPPCHFRRIAAPYADRDIGLMILQRGKQMRTCIGPQIGITTKIADHPNICRKRYFLACLIPQPRHGLGIAAQA